MPNINSTNVSQTQLSRQRATVTFGSDDTALASKKNSILTTAQATEERSNSNSNTNSSPNSNTNTNPNTNSSRTMSNISLEEDMLPSPSVIAMSNLRCPSPPPILQHPKPSARSVDRSSYASKVIFVSDF